MIDEKIDVIKGVGEKTSKLINKLGISTVGDMLDFYPRTYEDRRVKKICEINDGETVCIKASAIRQVISKQINRRMSIQKVMVSDMTGEVNITWFNQPWIAKNFNYNKDYNFYGKVSVKLGRVEMNCICYEPTDKTLLTGRFVPIYPLTKSLTLKCFAETMEKSFKYIDEVKEEFPGEIREKYRLCGKNYAISNIHFPIDLEKLEFARRRLKFEELFYMQIGLKMLGRCRKVLNGTALENCNKFANEFITSLPYHLTNAQINAIKDIILDIEKTEVMNRLVQGDVGCGKTVVAATIIYINAKNKKQSAMMAPTEILAKQHFETLTKLYENMDINVALLTGSMTKVQKNKIYEKLKDGTINVIVGTHALIQENVGFKELTLVVTDEQHRFGVKQRAALSLKGNAPHTLVMTATPIPRTVALMLYGDLQVSSINELPPGRKKVDTFAVDEKMRQRINVFMRKQLNEGRQIYVICPLVEENETLDLKSVNEFAKNLQTKILPEYRVGIVHGKMKAKEKEQIMSDFSENKISVLVSTTVIEVGVNVVNANTMIIENAERFGLSQLHQLRGRVGRGEWQSYCIMFCNINSEVTKERMKIMQSTNDGFVISEKDYMLRGPGEFFGTSQHGLPEMKIANLYTDIDIMKESALAMNKIIKDDPNLSKEENLPIKLKVQKMFNDYDIFESQ